MTDRPPGPPPEIRVQLHDYLAEVAARYAAAAYPGTYDGDPAGALFALLTDTAFAYEMEVAADALDPLAVQLGRAGGLTPRETVLTGLGENLDLKEAAPAMAPVNGWTAWRLARPEEGPERAGEPAGGDGPGEGPARF